MADNEPHYIHTHTHTHTHTHAHTHRHTHTHTHTHTHIYIYIYIYIYKKDLTSPNLPKYNTVLLLPLLYALSLPESRL